MSSARARFTFEDLLRHTLAHTEYPALTIDLPPETAASEEDVAIAERLIRAWNLAVNAERRADRPSGDVWEMVQYEFHGEFVAALKAGDARALAGILVRFFRHNVSYGMGGGQSLYDALLDEDGNRKNGVLTLDRLASLAESLAVLPYENPEQGRWGETLYLDPTEIAARIERKLGIPICPPQVGGYFGLRVGNSLIFATTCNQLYAACRLAQLAVDSPQRTLCEIGGGYGGCAYYAHLLGFRDYRLFDLPTVNVLQGYYLLKALPDARVVLFGEPESDSAVCVYPYWLLRKQPDGSFAVALNQDSLPEIAAGIARQYLRDIARTSELFLSINQESQGPSGPPGVHQNSVPEMADASGVLRRVSRHPFWLRAGYVEEVYRSVPDNSPPSLNQRIMRIFGR